MVLMAGLLSAGLWLSVGFDRRQYDLYTVYVPEPVSGLGDDSVVKYNGVRVGVVSKIELNQFDPQQVKIQLKIEEGTPITTSTHATLISQGITGATYLGLSATSPSLFPLQKTPGEPFPVIPYTPSFFSQLEKNINDVSIGIKRIFDKENAHSLKNALSNLQKITDVIAENHQNLNQSLQDLPKLLNGLQVSVTKFNHMAESMSSAGEHVSDTMAAGKNTIDKLSQQTMPPIVLLMQRLDVIASNLEKVSAQMRQNPAVVIRGNTPPKSGPGE
jgi:phospholipid/cholesterol/gamma-HCH transport system substrate-binding protein